MYCACTHTITFFPAPSSGCTADSAVAARSHPVPTATAGGATNVSATTAAGSTKPRPSHTPCSTQATAAAAARCKPTSNSSCLFTGYQPTSANPTATCCKGKITCIHVHACILLYTCTCVLYVHVHTQSLVIMGGVN